MRDVDLSVYGSQVSEYLFHFHRLTQEVSKTIDPQHKQDHANRRTI